MIFIKVNFLIIYYKYHLYKICMHVLYILSIQTYVCIFMCTNKPRMQIYLEAKSYKLQYISTFLLQDKKDHFSCDLTKAVRVIFSSLVHLPRDSIYKKHITKNITLNHKNGWKNVDDKADHLISIPLSRQTGCGLSAVIPRKEQHVKPINYLIWLYYQPAENNNIAHSQTHFRAPVAHPTLWRQSEAWGEERMLKEGAACWFLPSWLA